MMAESERACERLVAGRYALFDELGVGGMATVHIGRLRGAAGFTRTVAIKRLHPSFARDPEFVSMLIDEARLASRIRHPNVVQTIDVVVDKRELFVVMEYIHGESLASLMRLVEARKHRIPYRIVATLLVDVLQGLHAAHETKDEKGGSLELVHRDISPQNIIVGTDGLARVLDFGIAKSVGSLHVSQSGTLKGKFAYVAPEQIGENNVGRQADIYSASVVLWEGLTGQRLFHGDGAEATLAKVLAGNARAPSEVLPTLPRAFDAVVLRGLSKNPAQRYDSAKAMAADLERCCRLESHGGIANWLEQVAADGLSYKAECVARIERMDESSQSSDLRQLVGELVEPESINLRQRTTLVDELGAKAQGTSHPAASKFIGTVSVPAAVRPLKWRKYLIVAAAIIASALISLVIIGSSVGPQRSQTEPQDPRTLNLPAPAVLQVPQTPAIARDNVPSASASVASAANPVATESTNPQPVVERSHVDKPSTKKGTSRQVVRRANGSAGSAPSKSKSVSPFSALGGRT